MAATRTKQQVAARARDSREGGDFRPGRNAKARARAASARASPDGGRERPLLVKVVVMETNHVRDFFTLLRDLRLPDGVPDVAGGRAAQRDERVSRSGGLLLGVEPNPAKPSSDRTAPKGVFVGPSWVKVLVMETRQTDN